jgi:hypothetical protein
MALMAAAGRLTPGLDDRAHERAAVGRAARLFQALLQLLLAELAVERLLGHGAARLADVAVLVLDGELRRLAAAEHRVKPHGHARRLGLLVARAGRGEELLVLGLLLPGAEHVRPGFALVVALREALAGEDRLELPQILGRDALAVQGRAVELRDDRHILGPLHATLDLDGGDAQLFQLAQLLDEAVVAQAQGVARVLEPAVPVGQAAGLRALAAVAAAPADHGGQVALPRIAHAERAVHKHLEFHGAAAGDARDLLARQLPRQHDAPEAQLRRLLHALERVDAHLRRGVEHRVGRQLAHELRHAEILHDERVHAQQGRRAHDLGRARHLPVGDERVERQVYLDPADMAIDHGLLQLVRGKIMRAHARVEGVIAQINRIRTVLDGGAQRLHRSGGRQ